MKTIKEILERLKEIVSDDITLSSGEQELQMEEVVRQALEDVREECAEIVDQESKPHWKWEIDKPISCDWWTDKTVAMVARIIASIRNLKIE